MKNVLKLAAAAAVVFASTAFAADLPYKSPPVQPTSMDLWSGWYVGGNIGADWDHASAAGLTDSGSGLIGGVQVGYRRLLTNNFVLGLEGAFDFGNPSGTTAITKTISATFKTDFLASGRMIVGYVFPQYPALMIYGAGGIAASNSKISLTNGKNSLSDSEHPYGWVIGGGAEVQLAQYGWQDWSTGVEYNHYDFGSTAYCATIFGPACIGIHVKNTDDAVTWRLNRRFAL